MARQIQYNVVNVTLDIKDYYIMLPSQFLFSKEPIMRISVKNTNRLSLYLHCVFENINIKF